ncbi:uncharacterized protein BYT42DRAFT_466210, partial [Radiomyces spectabilis]|uniref:uncharacterized protein n=1 Tax=Radiomyces spectabilis TaxID=64574 RepID=UPI00221ED089
VWRYFWEGGLGPSVSLTGNIDLDDYLDCLVNKLLPWFQYFTKETGRQFILQEDGAPCHTGGYATSYK